jgi:hypothetical protein
LIFETLDLLLFRPAEIHAVARRELSGKSCQLRAGDAHYLGRQVTGFGHARDCDRAELIAPADLLGLHFVLDG